jgi:hypothetical protein
VSKTFGEWYQKTNKTEDTNKLTLEVHRTLLIWRLRAPDQGSTVDFFLFPRLKSIRKGAGFADVAAIQEHVTAVLRSMPKEAFADSFQTLYDRCQQCVVKDGDYFKANTVYLFVSSVLFVFCYHSPNVLDTPHIMGV